jgi:hypothetical protein
VCYIPEMHDTVPDSSSNLAVLMYGDCEELVDLNLKRQFKKGDLSMVRNLTASTTRASIVVSYPVLA